MVIGTLALARLVLGLFIVAFLVAPIALRARSKVALSLFVVLLTAFLSANPFSSSFPAAIFVVASWSLALLLGISVPYLSLGWAGSLPSVIAMGCLALTVLLPLILKKIVPGNPTLALILAFLIGPFGHLYVEDAAFWFVSVWSVGALAGLVPHLLWLTTRQGIEARYSLEIPKVWVGWEGLGLHIASALLMYVRLRQVDSTLAKVG